MKFKDGHPKLGGRVAGTPNKLTKQLQDTLVKHNFNAGETWLELLQDAREGFANARDDQKPQYLKIAADITSAIADRLYPRLKAIEHKTDRAIDTLSPQQRLEMLKAATQALENDISRHGRSVGSGSGDNESD